MERSRKESIYQKSAGGQPFTVFAFLLFIFPVFTFAQQSNEAVQQGNEAYKKNDYTTAVKEYTKALQADQKNTTAHFNMGNALQKNSDAANAAKSYDEVINGAGDADLHSKAYYNKALAMLLQKNLPEAINAFKQSLRLAPADGDTRENLQKALNELRQQQQQQQNQNKNQQQQPPPQQQKQKQPKMNKQMMEQKFNELRNQEKELQKQLQQQKTNTQQQEKDW